MLRIQIKRRDMSPLFLWENSTSLHDPKESSPPTSVTSAGWINAMNTSTSEVTPYLQSPTPYRNQTIYQWETLEVCIMCSPTFPIPHLIKTLWPLHKHMLHLNFQYKNYLLWNEAHNMEWSLSTTERLKSYNTLKQREVNFSIWVFSVPKMRGCA